MDGACDGVVFGHVVGAVVLVADADHIQSERFGMPHIRPDAGPLARLGVAVGEIDEIQVILHDHIAEILRIDIDMPRIAVRRLAGDAGEQRRQRLGVEILAQAEVLVESDLVALRVAGPVRRAEPPHAVLLAAGRQCAHRVLPPVLVARGHPLHDAAAGEPDERGPQRGDRLHQVAPQPAEPPLGIALAPVLGIHQRHAVQIADHGLAVAADQVDAQLAVLGSPPLQGGGQQMPVVRFPTDRGLRITRRHRGGRCRRITPERRGVRERQPVPIHHRHADIAVAGDGAQDHRELIPMPLYDRHRAGMGVRAAAVVPQVLHPGGRRFDAMPAVHGQARIPAVRVHRGRRTISGYGASVLVGPLRAATDGRQPLELPEPQRIGLGAPPLRTLHAQAVVVEVHAVETVVVHHIGVQAAVGPQIDVLEEHPVQPIAYRMRRLAHRHRHHIPIIPPNTPGPRGTPHPTRYVVSGPMPLRGT